jgi:hypothetical protein
MSWNQIELFHTIPSVIHLPFLISSCCVWKYANRGNISFPYHNLHFMMIQVFWDVTLWNWASSKLLNQQHSITSQETESSAALLWESQILHPSFHCIMYRFMISQIKPHFWTTEPCPFCNRSSFKYEEGLSKNVQICLVRLKFGVLQGEGGCVPYGSKQNQLFRFSQWCSWEFCFSGIWHCAKG